MLDQTRAAAFLARCIAPFVAHADTTVCVHNPGELQTALTNAQGSSATTFIEVARGTYNLGGNALSFEPSGTPQLDITGGYSGDCTTQILNPALTIIDVQYLSPVLSVLSSGGLSVRYLTIQHGCGTTYGPGLYVDLTGAGALILHYNIFRENVGEQDVALYALMDNFSTGDLHIDGNLFVNNTATQYLPAGEVQIFGTGNAYFTNNTVANNIITTVPARGYGGLGFFANTTLSNNIF
jgi:hypothetical protein